MVRPSPKLEPLNQVQLKWFADRGISAATLERNGVAAETLYISAAGREVPAIAFPYKRGAEVVNVKYRTQEKHFQVSGVVVSVCVVEPGGRCRARPSSPSRAQTCPLTRYRPARPTASQGR